MNLITGASGFLGSRVVERLLAAGERHVRCFVRPGGRVDHIERLRAVYTNANVEIVTGNLTRPNDAAAAVKRVRTIYHLAAAMSGSPADMVLNTVVASKNVVEAVSHRKSVRIVLVSSFGVYDTARLPAGSRIDESTPLERHPERRDPYSYSKWRQEKVFADARMSAPFELITLRPGVVYGPGGVAMSSRVGINLFGLFCLFGRTNLLPLSYVDNCADAVVLAGRSAADGSVFNVNDDDLPTAWEYLRQYRKYVQRVPYVYVPYQVTMLLSHLVERYHAYSRGQLPAVFTPYKTASLWKSTRFDNARLKALGWTQGVGTRVGMERALTWHGRARRSGER